MDIVRERPFTLAGRLVNLSMTPTGFRDMSMESQVIDMLTKEALRYQSA